MTYNEMKEAVSDANKTLNAADLCAENLATILVGRLHKVNNRYVLEKLKKELKSYNIQTHTWKQ